MADQVRFDTGGSSDSIDQLLASALAEQSREKKMLVDAVHGARDALRKAETELQEVRDLITSRDETLSEVLLRVQTIEEWSNRVSAQLDRIPQTIGESLASSQDLEDRLVSSNDDLLADIREDQVEVVRALGRTFDTALADVRRQLASARQDYLDQLEVATEHMIEKHNATAELMVEHLVGYLAKRDETMHKAREQMLIDMFKRLGASLGNRSSKKVAKAMGATTPPSPRPPDAPPAPKFKIPGAGRLERQSPFARRRGAPSRPPQQEPAPVPARQFASPGYQQEVQLDPESDDDFMSRDELAREYLKGQPQEHRNGEASGRASTVGPEPDDDFFAGPQGGPGPHMRPGPDRIGGPPRDA